MAGRLFGTDGIRGVANLEPITAETALAVAVAAGQVLKRSGAHPAHTPSVVIGKDTRLSGYLLEPALSAGFISVGLEVVLLGPLPTPGVAMLTRSLRADLGVMISASHNPFQDNGIKLFGPDGYKLDDDTEAAIEAAVADRDRNKSRASPSDLGRARRLEDAVGRTIEFVKSTFPRGRRLDGLKIVVDCAEGAAYKVAPAVFYELGATVIPIGVSPDGLNINRDGGATKPQLLQQSVVAHGADLGIALDGDADRVILCDEQGRVIDGDQVMALIALSWLQTGTLRGGQVVATVMSNLGLERYLEGLGVGLLRTAVGDRHVVEAMRREDCNVGGEASGHIVLSDYATTGDGLIAALQVLAVLVGAERPASEVLTVFEPVPQVLINVRSSKARQVLEATEVIDAIAAAEAQLGAAGRLLIRPSGTEPLVRIMAEGEDRAAIDALVAELAHTIEGAAESAP